MKKTAWGIYRAEDGDLCETIYPTRARARNFLISSVKELLDAWSPISKSPKKNLKKLFKHFMKGYRVVRLKIKID